MSEQFWFGLVSGLVVWGFVVVMFITTRAGSVSQALFGLTVAGRANRDPGFAAKLNELLGLPPAASPAPPSTNNLAKAPAPTTPSNKPTGEPLRLLALLQQEARLIDFLMENISSADDQAIGAAVREIHNKSQKVLQEHLVMETVLPGPEGEQVTVQKGFDPSAIRVVGNVTGEPPFRGELLHAGWKVKEIKLPTPPTGQNLYILQPAEVQV